MPAESQLPVAAPTTPAPPAVRLSRAEMGLANPYLPPRNAVESALAELCAAILGIEQVGIEDDFFALGGDSLKAAALFAAIAERFGRKLPLAVLIEKATIAHLAARIGDVAAPTTAAAAAPPSLLVPVKPTGALRPLFLVHGLHGFVYFASFVGRHLPQERPVYALQARGLDSDEPPHDSVPEMARDYLAAIRAVQPRGPYVLGGYCSGSIVAVEMAHLLVAAGEAVDMLFIIDPALRPPAGYVANTLKLEQLSPAEAETVIDGHRNAVRNLATVWRDRRMSEAEPALLDRAARVSIAIARAHFGHALVPFPGPVTFICSEQRARQAEKEGREPWSRLAVKGRMFVVKGSTHPSLFSRHGHMVTKIIASRLAELKEG